jgi:hypothetical protein
MRGVSVIAFALIVAGCGRAPIDDRLIAAPDDADRAPEGCGAEAGGSDDLASEPAEWLDDEEYIRWQDVDGCPIRVDVVAHVRGDEQCAWQDVDLLTVGVPLGASTAGNAERRTYYWDPSRALSEMPIGVGTIEREHMPESAVDTGLRLDGTELWVDDLDPTVMYHVLGDEVAVWQLDRFGQATCT